MKNTVKFSAILLIIFSLLFSSCAGDVLKKSSNKETNTKKAEKKAETNTKTNETKEVPSKKNELNFAITTDPDGLDPHRTVSASTFQITSNIYDGLVAVEPSGKIIPSLAKSWDISEDGMNITFELNSNIKFHNGNFADSNAIKSSFERLKGKDSPRASAYENIIKIEILSKDKIKFTTKELDVELLSSFAYPWAAIVDTTQGDGLKNKPIGTGAYKLKKWLPQQYLILEKNNDYIDKVNIDTINFKVIPSAISRTAALKAKEIDIMSITGDQIDTIPASKFNIYSNSMNSIQIMAFNNQNKYLNDVRIRKAIQYAIDKDSLIENIWYGYGEKIGSHYPPILKEYVDHSQKYPVNIEKAKELLKEAGYEDGFNLKMRLPKNFQAYVDVGQVIANDLKAININCSIEIVEWATWLEEVYKNRNYDLTVIGHTGRLDPYIFLSRYNSASGENYFNYKNDEVDRILNDVKQEKNEVFRMEQYGRIQDILADEVPALYIQSPKILMVMTKKLNGFSSYPIDIYSLKDLNFK